MFNSNLIFAIAARGSKVARVSYRPGQPGVHQYETDTDYANTETAALGLTSFTIGQLLETGFSGRATIILPDSAAIKGFVALSAIKNGMDAFEATVQEWMKADGNEEWLESISEFCEALSATADAENLSINFMKVSNLHSWNVSALKKGEAIDEALIGQTLKFENGINSEHGIALDNNRINGEFEIKATEYRTRDGETAKRFEVDRVNNGIRMKNTRKIAEKAWALVPAEEELGDELDIAVGDEF